MDGIKMERRGGEMEWGEGEVLKQSFSRDQMCRLCPWLPSCVPVDGWLVSLGSPKLLPTSRPWAFPYPQYHNIEDQAGVLLPVGASGIPLAPHRTRAAAIHRRIAIGTRRIWLQSIGDDADHVDSEEGRGGVFLRAALAADLVTRGGCVS